MTRFDLGRGRRVAAALAASAVASLACASGAFADTPAATGTFVIGDLSAVPSATVTFWGAQWWKDNSLSGGSAPAAFKGYADNVAPACGPWSTRPGNSSDPPATIQADGLVPMIVSSNITKNGPVISGDTAAIAWVEVQPGYGPDPGHAGTGTVLTVVPCPPAGGGDGGSGGSGGGGGPTIN